MPETCLPKGVITPLITPFLNDRVDDARLRALIERQIAAGIHGIIACDQTGEGLSLTADERSAVIASSVDSAGGRIPLIAASGTNCTSQTIDIVAAVPHGVAALLVTVPFYSKPTAKGIVHHFEEIAATTTLPIIIDDDPRRTASPLTWEILDELRHVENIRGVRHCSADITGFLLMPKGLKRRFRHYAGHDRTALAYLMAGASSISSPIANLFPDLVCSFHDMRRAHTMSGENAVQERLCSAIETMGDGEPAILKYALSLLLGGSETVRLPLVAIDDDEAAGIQAFLERYLSQRKHLAERLAVPNP